MSRNLTFGQKLGIIIGCALLLEGAVIVGIGFYYSKYGPPKDIEKLIPKWARDVDLKNEETWAKTEEFSSIQIERNPKSAFWYKERGYARWWLKKYDQAISDFDRVIELDPKDYLSLSYRGQLHTYKGEYRLAIQDFDKAITMQPKSGSYYYHRGVAYDWLNETNNALINYDKALELGYEPRGVHNAKGSLYAREKDFQKAKEEYEAASKFPQTEKNDDTFEKLIRLYIAEGQMQKAEQASKRWVQESHSDQAHLAAISIAHALENKTEETAIQKQYIENLTERIADEPNAVDIYRKRARVYKQMGDKVRAEKEYNDLLKLLAERDKSESPVRWRRARRAEILKDAGRKEEARKVYEEQVALLNQDLQKHPENQKLYMERAFLHMRLGDYRAALKDFEKAENEETSSTVLHEKLEIAIKNHQYETACQLVKKMRISTTRSLVELARIHELMGKHAEAVAGANQALERDKTNAAAYFWLGKALASQGKIAESRQRLQQARALGFKLIEEN